jgi:DNA repair protein RadC
MEEQGLKAEAPHLGHRQRLRARFASSGLDGFAAHEALELLLTYAIPRVDVKPLAHRLIRQFGSLNRVLEASAGDLKAVEGIGESASTLLSLLLPLLRLYRKGQTDEVEGPEDQERLMARCEALLMGERVERFLVLALDARGRFITQAFISSGDESETAVYPRLIARELLRAGAAACVLAHNHPSGLARPSRADTELTQALKAVLEPLGIRLKDHVIVAGEGAFSFSREGLL